mmetsp:Transcript_12292/g.15874  ORF Transcript_12292/g.15874 Transcript_12292/m.15874 type:complete len:689 (+) Transcript_12292:91-2157(+)
MKSLFETTTDMLQSMHFEGQEGTQNTQSTTLLKKNMMKSLQPNNTESSHNQNNSTPVNFPIHTKVDFQRNIATVEALHAAVANGDIILCQKLLEKGVFIDAKSGEQQHTALHEATVYGNTELIEFLVINGASVNARSASQASPLHLACQYGQDAAVMLLLKYKADIEMKMEKGATALHVACGFGQIATIKILLEHGAALDSQMTDLAMPIHIAAIRGQAAAIKLLLSYGVGVNAVMSFGRTALHLAARYGNSHVVQLLLANNADIHHVMEKNLTPLHTAALWGHTGCVQTLLERGARTEAQMDNRLTPLHMSCQCGHYAVVKALLDSSADIEAKNENGWTPLHFACFRGHAQVVYLLCENGASLTVTNSEGYMPGQIFNDDVTQPFQYKIRMILEKFRKDEMDGKWRQRYRLEKLSLQKAHDWIEHLRGANENAERRAEHAQNATDLVKDKLAQKVVELNEAALSKKIEVERLISLLGVQQNRADDLKEKLDDLENKKELEMMIASAKTEGGSAVATLLDRVTTSQGMELQQKETSRNYERNIAAEKMRREKEKAHNLKQLEQMETRMKFLADKHKEDLQQLEEEKCLADAEHQAKTQKLNKIISKFFAEKNTQHSELLAKDREIDALKGQIETMRLEKREQEQKYKNLQWDLTQVEARYKQGTETCARLQVELDSLKAQMAILKKEA